MKFTKLLCVHVFVGLFHGALGGRIAIRSAPMEAEPDADAARIMDVDPMLKSFFKKTPHIPLETIEKLDADLMKESNEEDEAAAVKVGECVVDWSAPCPLSWKVKEKVETGEKECTAPQEYTGLCKTTISFEMYTPPAKQEWATTCGVKWPCKGDEKHTCPNGRDYHRPCPEGFLLGDDEESCNADVAQYEGPCQGSADFSKFSVDAKKDWSETCGAFWPCLEDCEAEYVALCPEKWEDVGEFQCVASDHYNRTGTCAGSANFKYYTPAMKKKFETTCGVHFPCENTCDKNYTSACPMGWIFEDNTCKAEKGNNNCGITQQSFKEYGIEDKAKFENDCGVEWPCNSIDICERNWTLPCPEFWDVIPPPGVTAADFLHSQHMKGFQCVPPTSYDGICKKPESFGEFSEEDRRKWASNCKHSWPCTGAIEVHGNPLRPSFTPENEATAINVKAEQQGKRPKPPYYVGTTKRGPIHHVTGEIMPLEQDVVPSREEVVGKSVNYQKTPRSGARKSRLGGHPERERLTTTNIMEYNNIPSQPQKALTEKSYDRGPKGYHSGGYYMPGTEA